MTNAQAHSAAVHECSHALAGIQYGYRILSLTMTAIRFDHPTLATPDDALKLLALGYAGGLGQMKLGLKTCSCPHGCIASDERHNGAILEQWFTPEQRADAETRARALAAETVENHWPAIDGLALALMNWRTMDGKTVSQLLPAFALKIGC